MTIYYITYDAMGSNKVLSRGFSYVCSDVVNTKEQLKTLCDKVEYEAKSKYKLADRIYITNISKL